MARSCNPNILRPYFLKDLEGHARTEELAYFRDDLEQLFQCVFLKTITGTVSISALAIGDSVDIYKDHSADETFRLSEYPYFTAVDGIDVLVYAMLDIGGTGYATDGSGFVVRVTNVSVGGTAGATLNLNWSRTGMPTR